jgi:hypothetical protein
MIYIYTLSIVYVYKHIYPLGIKLQHDILRENFEDFSLFAEAECPTRRPASPPVTRPEGRRNDMEKIFGIIITIKLSHYDYKYLMGYNL